jgi:hypothetical protein
VREKFKGYLQNRQTVNIYFDLSSSLVLLSLSPTNNDELEGSRRVCCSSPMLSCCWSSPRVAAVRWLELSMGRCCCSSSRACLSRASASRLPPDPLRRCGATAAGSCSSTALVLLLHGAAPPQRRGDGAGPPPPRRGSSMSPPPPQRGDGTGPPPPRCGSSTSPPPPQRGGGTGPPPPQHSVVAARVLLLQGVAPLRRGSSSTVQYLHDGRLGSGPCKSRSGLKCFFYY